MFYSAINDGRQGSQNRKSKTYLRKVTNTKHYCDSIFDVENKSDTSESRFYLRFPYPFRFPRVHLNQCANVVNAAEIIDLDDNQQKRRGSFGGNSSDDNNSTSNKGLTRRER